MDIQAEKLDLIQWLTQLTDEKVIAKIKALKNGKNDWWDELDEAAKHDLEEGLADLDAGRKKDFGPVMDKYR